MIYSFVIYMICVFKSVQNLFKCVQRCLKLVQMCSNVFKIVQKLSAFPVQGVRHNKQSLIQFAFSLVITCFQDIESLSDELGVIRGKEDTCELELLEVRKSHQTQKTKCIDTQLTDHQLITLLSRLVLLILIFVFHSKYQSEKQENHSRAITLSSSDLTYV